MPTNYVLVDFENLQPKNLGFLKSKDYKVFVFVDAKQSKLDFDTVLAVQDLGINAQYIKINGAGSNALDFHMAYFLGELIFKDGNGCFFVVSKDRGFDPLVQHISSKKITISRMNVITDISDRGVSTHKKQSLKINEPS